MNDLRALWVATVLGCAVATVQAQTPSAPAALAKESAKAVAPARPADPEPPRRLKFKSRGSNCLCDDPITEEEIDAAAARRNPASTQTQTPRSKP